MTKQAKFASWVAQLVVVGIIGPAGVIKLMGSPDPILLFETLGVEPWGRYFTAAMEIGASILILIPATIPIGGLLTAVIMLGAIGSHLTILGIDWGGDVSLFVMAIVAFLASVATVMLRSRAIDDAELGL